MIWVLGALFKNSLGQSHNQGGRGGGEGVGLFWPVALNCLKNYWSFERLYHTWHRAWSDIQTTQSRRRKKAAGALFSDSLRGVWKSDEILPLVFDILHDGLHDGVLVHHILWSSQWHNTPWKPALNWRYHHTLIEPKTIMGLQLDFCWEREWKNTCQI